VIDGPKTCSKLHRRPLAARRSGAARRPARTWWSPHHDHRPHQPTHDHHS